PINLNAHSRHPFALGQAAVRCSPAKKNRTMVVRFLVCRHMGRQSPSRGEQLTTCNCRKQPDCRQWGEYAPCRFPQTIQSVHASHGASALLGEAKAQKCQRWALATRKSRNTWTRATDFNSSG